MPILQITTDFAGQVGVLPRLVRLLCNDSLATVTAPGYLNNVASLGVTILPTDFIFCSYNGGFDTFNPVIVGSNITLVSSSSGSPLILSATNAITAYAGGGQSNAAALPSEINRVTTVTSAGDSVVLPPSMAGFLVVVINSGSNPMQVFGTSPDTINGAATGKGISQGPNTVVNYWCPVAGSWFSNINVNAGGNALAGSVTSWPSVAASGALIWAAVTNSAGNFNTTVSNASSVGQSQVISVPDSGAATAKFLLDTGTGSAISINNLKYGATPLPQVDPGSCTITAAAGAANTATITIQLKDGSGTNLAYSMPFRVYSSSAANGLTLQSAASTGYSVASGGLSLANGTAITTQISCMSSATGGCVLSLLDTGKQTSYLVLVLHNGVKISAQLTAGSYG